MKFIGVVGLIGVVSIAAGNEVLACPTCYGAADGPVRDGLNMAVLAMLGVTGVVLTAITSFFVMMRRRIRQLHEVSHQHSFVDEKGDL